MKILYYNWVQFDKKNNPGGGVNVYQKNIIDYLKNDKNNQIYFLSSGIDYDLFSKKIYYKESNNIYGGNCRTFKIFNSPCVAPAKAMYNDLDKFMDNEEIFDVFVDFIKEYGEFDVIHFNNIEGLSTKCLEIKKIFPNTKVIFSIHNYCLFCPQINLYFNNEKNCLNYKNGMSCVECIKNKEKKSNFINYYKFDKYMEKFHLYKLQNKVKLLGKKILSKKSVNNINDKNDVEKFAENVVLFRKKNISRLNENVDYILAVSDRVRKIAINFGVNEGKIFTEYIGTKFAENAKNKLAKKEQKETFCISYMGYFEKMKGFDFLIDALNAMPDSIAKKIDFKCYARIKNDDDVKKVEKVVLLENKLNSSVHFNGYTHEQLNLIMDEIDLGIVPVVWEDNLPQVAIEYVAHGVPVLTSDLGGAQELSKATEFVFKSGNINDFVEKISNIIEDRQILNKYFEKSIKLTSVDQHIKNLLKYYNKK